jgi:hypothetical protein
MPGTKDLVRLPTGTDQESDGMLIKFLEPPTGLAPVPQSSTLLAHRMLASLCQDPQPQALVMLTEWAHPWRRLEIDEEAVMSIVTSTDEDALEALKEFCNCRMFQRGNGHSLTLPVLVEVNGHVHRLEGLVDSSCKGSCIN